jgi:magnesium-transporting ATPase (P-type)
MTTGVITDDTVTMLSASNIGFMGTDIIEGQGKGIVIATGASNQVSALFYQLYFSSLTS